MESGRIRVSQERYPAKWDEYGKNAGHIRNAEMVKLGADRCFVYLKNNSPGATSLAKMAWQAGISIIVVDGEGRLKCYGQRDINLDKADLKAIDERFYESLRKVE